MYYRKPSIEQTALEVPGGGKGMGSHPLSKGLGIHGSPPPNYESLGMRKPTYKRKVGTKVHIVKNPHYKVGKSLQKAKFLRKAVKVAV